MSSTLYGVQFGNGMWHTGYDHMSPAIGEAFLSDIEWATSICRSAMSFGGSPRVVAVEFDRVIRLQPGLPFGNHPDRPLTPLALECELIRDDRARKHWPYNN